MPALPAVSKVIRFDLTQTIGANTRVKDRLFFSYSGTLSAADLGTLITTMANAWGTDITLVQSNQASLTQIEGTDLSSATSPQVITSVSKVGQGTTPALSAGTALVVKFKIARRYRGGHPRFYLTGISNNQLSNPTTWVSSLVSAAASDFAAFVAACVLSPPAAVGTLAHVNVSYFQGFTNKTFPSGRTRPVPSLRAAPVVDTVIGYAVNPNVASQRRRNLQSV